MIQTIHLEQRIWDNPMLQDYLKNTDLTILRKQKEFRI